MTTNDVSLRMLRSRSRQAQEYSRIDTQPEPESTGYQPRSNAVTLPTLACLGYDRRPMAYERGRLMVGDEVVRVRKEGRS